MSPKQWLETVAVETLGDWVNLEDALKFLMHSGRFACTKVQIEGYVISSDIHGQALFLSADALAKFITMVETHGGAEGQ